MYTITKEFTFEAAHLLNGHPKCGRLHGHSYRVVVELQAAELNTVSNSSDEAGMVVDYAHLNPIKDFIDLKLDHRLLIGNEILDSSHMDWIKLLPDNQVCLCLVYRTTAEELAKWMYTTFKGQFPELTAVTVCETAKTTATYRLERGLR